MRTDVFGVHHLLDAAFEELLVYMFVDAGEDDGDLLFVRALDEHGQVVHGCGVHEWHLTHTDDTDRVFLARYVGHDVVKPVGDAEEIRAVDLIHFHAFGDGEVFEVGLHIGVLVGVDLVVEGAYLCLLGGTHEEEHECQKDSDLDSHGEVEDHGQEERDEQYGEVATGVFDQPVDRFPAGHRVSHHNQHRSQTSHRNHTHQLSQEQQHQQQHDGVDDTGDRRSAAVVDIGHSACDGAGGGNASEERHHEVGYALCDKLGVGVVPVADDAVSHHG